MQTIETELEGNQQIAELSGFNKVYYINGVIFVLRKNVLLVNIREANPCQL